MEIQLRSDIPALYPYNVQLIHYEHTKRYIRTKLTGAWGKMAGFLLVTWMLLL